MSSYTEEFFGLGTLLQRGDGAAPEVFATVGKVTDLSGPELSMDDWDKTNHSSPNAYKQTGKGQRDAGEISADMWLIPGDPMFLTLHEDFEDLTETDHNWRILLPNGFDACIVPGHVSGLGAYEFPTDDGANFTLTVKCTGKPEWTTVPVGP